MSTSHSTEPEYDMGVSDGLTGLAKLAAVLAVAAGGFLALLVVAAPWGDRRSAIPEDPRAERLGTRATQYISATLWGLGAVPVAIGLFASLTVPLAGAVILPVALVYGWYLMARRVSAGTEGVWYPPRTYARDLLRACTGPRSRYVSATIVVALAVSLVLFLTGVTDSGILLLLLVATQLIAFVTSLRLGSRYGTDLAYEALQRERLGDELASILGVPAAAMATVRFMEGPTGALQVWPVPASARLKSLDEIEARVAAVLPAYTVAEWSPEALVIEIADHSVLDQRDRLRASGGLVSSVDGLVVDSPEDGAPADLDFRALDLTGR